MKILAIGPNSTKFCIHNLRASRELEMPKLTTQIEGASQKMKILAIGPNSTKFCIHYLWAFRRLEMHKLGAGGGWAGGVVRRCGSGASRGRSLLASKRAAEGGPRSQ